MKKELDVLFIHTNAAGKIYQKLSKNLSAIEPPIWAGLLANHTRLKGYETKILDCEAERLTCEASADEMFVMNKDHFLELCKKIIDRKYNFNIWAYARIDTVKEEYLDILKNTAAEVVRFRDNAFHDYYESIDYLDFIEKKFGISTRAEIEKMTSHRLKRKILGD